MAKAIKSKKKQRNVISKALDKPVVKSQVQKDFEKQFGIKDPSTISKLIKFVKKKLKKEPKFKF